MRTQPEVGRSGPSRTWRVRSAHPPPASNRLSSAIAALGGPGGGHIHVAGERSVVQQTVVELERLGLQPGQVSAKAYWGMGQPNATHGEPTAP